MCTNDRIIITSLYDRINITIFMSFMYWYVHQGSQTRCCKALVSCLPAKNPCSRGLRGSLLIPFWSARIGKLHRWPDEFNVGVSE